MPVLTEIVCELVDWAACAAVASSSLGCVSEGRSPPSRLRASMILVSLVSRASAAERTLAVDPMLRFLVSLLVVGAGERDGAVTKSSIE